MGPLLRICLSGVVLAACAQGHSPEDAGGVGRDAGRLDAGVDAGPPDAGMDAAPPDASVPDAGPTDAAAPDGGVDAGPECTDDGDCESRRCEDGTCVAAPRDCAEVLVEDPTAATGIHFVDPDGLEGAPGFDVQCDMDFDGGGWTLVGTVANDGTRRWNSVAAFIDGTAFGDLAAPTADLKSDAWGAVAADDLLVRTDEYAVGWEGLLAGTTLASWIAAEYDDTTCSTTFLGGRPDWAEGLTGDQIDLFDVVVRAVDDNAGTCFPDGNENALLTFTLQSCCWTNGIGNTPAGHEVWETHDLSLLRAANLVRGSCTAGTYPCNPRGYWNAGSSCYDTTCKVAWAQIWVR